MCGTVSEKDLWLGSAPLRYDRGVPRGKQITGFTRAIHKYQAYCAENNLKSMPLYEEDDQRLPGVVPAPFDEATLKEWTSTLMGQWLRDELPLPLDEEGNVPFRGKDFGKGAQVCAKLPSFVNYVSDCNCKIDPQCESPTMHKYVWFVGLREMFRVDNIVSPIPTSCSYFRQLEILNETGIDSFTPHSDYVMRESTFGLSANMILDYDVDVNYHEKVATPYPLRQKLQAAMVTNWDEGLTDFEKVYKRYYDQCSPAECYYEKAQVKEFGFYMNAFILAFGGLATILMAVIHGGINGISSAAVIVLKLVASKETVAKVGHFTRPDIYQLQQQIVHHTEVGTSDQAPKGGSAKIVPDDEEEPSGRAGTRAGRAGEAKEMRC